VSHTRGEAIIHSFDEAARRIRETLEGRTRWAISLESFRPASVLVPVLRRPSGPTLLFTRRRESLSRHKGQIAFPGGHRDAGETAVQAALREAAEEVALPRESVDVAGVMDDQPSVTNYVVTPVVGMIVDPPEAFSPQETEVLDLFEVPLDRLLDPDRSYQEWWDASRMPAGADKEKLFTLGSRFAHCDPATRCYGVDYFDPFPGSGRVIWGLTARILERFLRQVFGFRIAER
jgi:8-oxo-dGTP pyrophosphatase MutT (NUDIX family)